MTMDLRRRIRHEPLRHQYRDVLCRGPWAWPDESDPRRYEAALDILPSGPPDVPPGVVAVVTVCGQTTTLWRLAADTGVVGLGKQAEESWRSARLSLPRALPVLWSSLSGLERVTVSATRIDAAVGPLAQEQREVVIDGPSAGLSLALLAASRAFGVPVPADVVASAAIDSYGRVLPVAGLQQKIAGLSVVAPRVRRLLVAPSELPDDLADVAPGITVVPVPNVAKAFEEVFGDALVRRLIAAESEADRGAIAESFFALALRGRGQLVDWTPILAGARLALERWNGFDEIVRFHLEFAAATAGRHEQNRGVMPTPPSSWLATRPRPLRLSVFAHMTQQAADTGSPSSEALAELFGRELGEPVPEVLRDHWELYGAWARLIELEGDLARAVELQAGIATAFIESYSPEDASFALSSWFRLAGVLSSEAHFTLAREALSRADAVGGLGRDGLAYVLLARARAALALGLDEPDTPRDLLSVASADDVAAHVRCAAHRWMAVHCRRQGDTDASNDWVSWLERYSGDTSTEGHAAGIQLVLSKIDLAIDRGDVAAVAAGVASLEKLDPGLISRLMAQGLPPAEIARRYPY